MISITNDGPNIVAWTLPDDFDERGKFLISINAGAFRIILPRAYYQDIPEMETGYIVHVQRGQWQVMDSFRIMFDDGTDDPYTMFTSVNASDILPFDSDRGRSDLICSVWIDRRKNPHLALIRPATYK